jgi:hypothetical protein
MGYAQLPPTARPKDARGTSLALFHPRRPGRPTQDSRRNFPWPRAVATAATAATASPSPNGIKLPWCPNTKMVGK